MDRSTVGRILLAEDDPEDRFLIQRAWRKAGGQAALLEVEDGAGLLDYLKGRGDYSNREHYPLPALVLLDLNMPRLDGREVLAELRADPGLRGMPVTETTEPGISPCRTRSSTRATAARPSSGVKSVSRNSGARRVTQIVSATCDTSSRICRAEIPAPTITTR